jgi:hypothetical protein
MMLSTVKTKTNSYVMSPSSENEVEELLTKLNELYLANKVSAIRYTKLEKLIFSSDSESLIFVTSLLNSF